MRKSSLGTVFFTVFLDLLGIGIIIPVLAPLFFDPNGILPIETTYATRALMLGLLSGVYPFAQFFGAPILGAMSDRFGRKPVLLMSQAGSCIGYLLFALGISQVSIPLLFLSRVIDGFTGGNVTVAMSAIADQSDAKNRAKNFGLIGMAFGLGFILGPYIGGKLADPRVVSWFTPSTPFLFAALLTALNMLSVIVRFPETLKEKRMVPISLSTGFRNIVKGIRMPNVRALLAVTFFFTLGFNFFTQFFSVYLVSYFGYTSSGIGDVFAYIGLWIAITQGGLTRVFAKRFAPTDILAYSLLGLAIVLPALLLPQTRIGLFCVMPFLAICNGLTMANSRALLSNSADASSQGEVMGIGDSLSALAMTIPPVLSGILVTIDLRLPTLVAGVTVLVAWACFVLWFTKGHQQKFHAT